MAVAVAALGAATLDALPQTTADLLDKLRLMCCMNESSAVPELLAQLSPALLADSEVQIELVRVNWKCFCKLPLEVRVGKKVVMWAVTNLLSTSVSRYPSEELDLQLELLLKEFLVHAAAADVKEIALCAVAHAPWALTRFPTMQGDEMVVTKAMVGRMSKEMLLHVFPYVRPNTLPILMSEVLTAIDGNSLYENVSHRRFIRDGSRLEALKLTSWGRKFTKMIEDQVGNTSILLANSDAVVAIAKWMFPLLKYSDPVLLDDPTVVANLCIDYPGSLEMVSEVRRRDKAMIKIIARHPRFVAASSSFLDRVDGSKSIQIFIDRHGDAINVTFGDLAGNQAYQPHQFPNGSVIKDLCDYISSEAACTRIALFDESENVPNDHDITAYRSLVAAIPVKGIDCDEKGMRGVNGIESPHYVAGIKKHESENHRLRWYESKRRRPPNYMAADKGDTAALLKYSHESLKSDADLVMFLAYNPDAEICYPRCLKAIMLAAVETNGLALKYTGVMHGDENTSTGPWMGHQGSKDIAIAALKQNKSAAQYLYSRQKEQPEIKELLKLDPAIVVAVSRR